MGSAMTFVLSAIVWNTLIASGLAVLVGFSGQTPWLRRRPAVMHTLWLLVLAKFITPAFVPLPLLPTQPSATVSFQSTTLPATIPAQINLEAPAQPAPSQSILPAVVARPSI